VDGTAAVVEGVLVVVAPAAGGRPARVEAGEGVRLRVDGFDVGAGPVEAVPGAHVDAIVESDEPQLEIDVRISDDGLHATASLTARDGGRFALADQPHAAQLALRRMFVKRLPCPPATIRSVVAALREAGVVIGIDGDAIAALVRRGSGTAVVARGRAAVRGREAAPALDPRRQVERFVAAGTVLGTMRDGEPAVAGMTVRGDVLPAETLAAEAGLGDGVRVVDGRIVATIDGHLSLAEGSVTVVAALRIPGDVGHGSGEVSSPGSIEIAGSVEGGLVRARRSIWIADGVRRSTVEAGFALEIGGTVLDAELKVGAAHAELAGFCRELRPLVQTFARLHQAVGQLLAGARAVGKQLHPVRALSLACERVAPTLDADLKHLLAASNGRDGVVSVETLTRIRAAERDLDGVRGGRLPIDALARAARSLAGEERRLATMTAEPAALVVPLLQKTRCNVIGDLFLTGRGAVECDVRVVGRLEAAQPDALVRGGTLYLDGTGLVHELAPGTDGLEVVLAAGSRLDVDVLQAGVVLVLDGRRQRVDAACQDVTLEATPRAAA
jgi:hypothetical protein